jgi:hypothetical protein
VLVCWCVGGCVGVCVGVTYTLDAALFHNLPNIIQ